VEVAAPAGSGWWTFAEISRGMTGKIGISLSRMEVIRTVGAECDTGVNGRPRFDEMLHTDAAVPLSSGAHIGM
jgi:hypothetical protein